MSCTNSSKNDSDNDDSSTVEVSEGSPVTCLWSTVTVIQS